MNKPLTPGQGVPTDATVTLDKRVGEPTVELDTGSPSSAAGGENDDIVDMPASRSGRPGRNRATGLPQGSHLGGGDGIDAPSAERRNPDRRLPVDPTKISPKLGELLVAAGKMNREAVARVLRRQKKFPDRRFGELAVGRGFASRRDVDAALARQFGYTAAIGAETTLSTEIAVAHTPYSPFAEVVRGLRSQLMLNWFDGSLQQSALAVTSVDPGDGKSFIIANLGVVFSQLGERTLIIDADLRNSSQHRKFGLRNKMGLSGLLSGRAGVDEIQAVQGLSNLAVLPAGPLPPNPQELLGRDVFGQLITALANSFDVILIDTPAAQMSTDAQIIAQRTRGALIVGRKDRTRSSEIEQLGQVLTGSGIKVLGSVLNDY